MTERQILQVTSNQISSNKDVIQIGTIMSKGSCQLVTMQKELDRGSRLEEAFISSLDSQLLDLATHLDLLHYYLQYVKVRSLILTGFKHSLLVAVSAATRALRLLATYVYVVTVVW
jgi:hypothetical protein